MSVECIHAPEPNCPGPNCPGPNCPGPNCPGPNLPRTPDDEHNETNTVESNSGETLKGDDRVDVTEEANTIQDMKSHVKKRPIMTVTFPKNVPQIKNIRKTAKIT